MIQNSDATLPSLPVLLSKWWKMILGTVMIFTTIAAIVLLIKPKEYLGVSTALPASGYATDKASIFNDNIQSLYSGMGLPDDLDRIVGTSKLDTLYGLLVDEFNLVNHYGLDNKKNSRYKAIDELKDNVRVLKSDYGELKVKVWDKDPIRATRLSQSLMKHLQQLHQALQLTNNKLVLKNLEQSYKQIIQQLDSVETIKGTSQSGMHAVRAEALINQAALYEKLLAEYRLLINTNPQVLVVVENAPVPVNHDRPDYLLVIGLTIITSFLFAILAVVVFEKRNTTLS